MPESALRNISAISGQAFGWEFREQGMYLFFLASVLIAGGLIFLLVVRRFAAHQRRRADQGAQWGLASLNDRQQKGLLTPEETAKVRNALVRQALRKEELAAQPEAPAGLAAAHAPPPPPAAPVAAPLSPSPPATTPSAAPTEKPDRLDMEKLLKKGLISQEEYDQIRKRFGSVK